MQRVTLPTALCTLANGPLKVWPEIPATDRLLYSSVQQSSDGLLDYSRSGRSPKNSATIEVVDFLRIYSNKVDRLKMALSQFLHKVSANFGT